MGADSFITYSTNVYLLGNTHDVQSGTTGQRIRSRDAWPRQKILDEFECLSSLEGGDFDFCSTPSDAHLIRSALRSVPARDPTVSR
jgi:hypothetical protein